MSFADENPETTAAVIIALRSGLGVEDMQARSIASAEYARMVIKRLRRNGLLCAIYGRYRRGSEVPRFRSAAE